MRSLFQLAVFIGAAVLNSAVQAQSPHLNRPSGLDTRGIDGSEWFQSVYLGRFAELRQMKFSFPMFFSNSAAMWSAYCASEVAPGSPTLSITVTSTNGYGNQVGSNTRRYLIDKRFAEKVSEYGVPFVTQKFFQHFYERNGCSSNATQQYHDNLLRYAYGKPSIQEERAASK